MDRELQFENFSGHHVFGRSLQNPGRVVIGVVTQALLVYFMLEALLPLQIETFLFPPKTNS